MLLKPQRTKHQKIAQTSRCWTGLCFAFMTASRLFGGGNNGNISNKHIRSATSPCLFLPGELEAFHQYSEECLISIACCGHWAARSHRRMLTDSLPVPHLPYTDQERCTGRRREERHAQADGWSGTEVWMDDPLGFLQPLCYIPSLGSRCRSAEHLCQKFTPPWVSSFFPKEKEVTCTATFAKQAAACSRSTRASDCK